MLLRKKADHFDFEVLRECKCCGTTFQGRFCNRCGEKVTEPYERSILHFLNSLLNAFTFFDGKFVRSLKVLITHPGRLSRNLADGNRVPYMKMVSFFFVANFLYFLFPLWDSFNSSLYTQTHLLSHREQAERMVNERLEKERLSLEEFTKEYEAQSTNLSKLLLVLVVVMFAIVLAVINFSRKAYFFDHLLFSLEFFTFHILLNLLLITYLLYFIIKAAAWIGLHWQMLLGDNYFTLITYVTIAYFLIRGQINFYGQKWYWAALRTTVLILSLLEIAALFRWMLFHVTMQTL